MKNKFPVFFLAFFISWNLLRAQSLYLPRNIKAAFQNGTRSPDGNPGKNYWQNHGKYTMSITVNAETKIVTGTENIAYTNNSRDTLKALVIRFVNNLHKPTSPRSGSVNPDFLTSGLNITSFVIDGERYATDSRSWGTTADITLKKPLLPGASTVLNIDWNYPLSKESGREGQIDSTTFFVAYAYPRISVYDDYNGWDRLPHVDRGEFYNDFNDYVFSVKAPRNYVVWATGDLLNPDEVLQKQFAERLKKSYTSDEVIHIASAKEMQNGEVTKQEEWNTWKFSVNNISDITFGMSSHYLWDASSVIVDHKTNRRVSTQAAYSTKGTDFVNSVKYSSYALAWFSENWPGVTYPFSKMTAFQGFADMEYPMMVNDSNWGIDALGRMVQDHEIAHTYFPFYMGINETRYAYMDEGWATTLEYLIGITENGKANADENYKNFRVKDWIQNASTEEDQPIISMSTQVSGAGYGNNSYVKASLSYLALKDLLGDDEFKKALHVYMDRWHSKHPIPWDFFNSINDATKQNLNWFWNNWYFSNNYIDLVIDKVNLSASGGTIDIRNEGGFAIPFDVNILYSDGSKTTLHQTPVIWKASSTSARITFKSDKKIKSVTLDGGIFMDATPKNNYYSDF